jgi:hypothetical protein
MTEYSFIMSRIFVGMPFFDGVFFYQIAVLLFFWLLHFFVCIYVYFKELIIKVSLCRCCSGTSLFPFMEKITGGFMDAGFYFQFFFFLNCIFKDDSDILDEEYDAGLVFCNLINLYV